MKFKAINVMMILCAVCMGMSFGARASKAQDLYDQYVRLESKEDKTKFLESLSPDQLMTFARLASVNMSSQNINPEWFTQHVFDTFRTKWGDMALNERLVSVVTDTKETGVFRVQALWWFKGGLAQPGRKSPGQLLSPGQWKAVYDACYKSIPDKRQDPFFRHEAGELIGGLWGATLDEITRSGLVKDDDKTKISLKHSEVDIAKERGFVNPRQGEIENAVMLFMTVVTNKGEQEIARGAMFGGLWLCLRAGPSDSLRIKVKAQLTNLIDDPQTPGSLFFLSCDTLSDYFDVGDLANGSRISRIEARMGLLRSEFGPDEHARLAGQKLLDELRKSLANDHGNVVPGTQR